MNKLIVAVLASLLLGACANSEHRQHRLGMAEAFIDAFYSFDKNRLESLLVAATGSVPVIVYYQGWAEGGNYKIVRRMPCEEVKSDVVSCAITVQDDPMLALGIDFNVTDTFHITFAGDEIVTVETTSNDLQVYHDAGAWVMKELPELIEKPCRGFFDGGPTPADCARAMTKGYALFANGKVLDF